MLKKFLTITLIINLVTTSLALQFIQDDILAYPRYKVVLTNEKISNSQVHDKDIELSSSSSSMNSIVMTSSSGQPFSCSIPNVQIEQERLEREKEEQAKEETEEDIQNTIEKGLELLEPLETNCMRFYPITNQYWAYEYCHNQYVRQFHIERSHDGKEEKEQETQSYYLGICPASFDNENDMENNKALSNKPKKSNVKAPTTMKKVGDQRYLVQEWKNGSNCDLTDKPRTVEVLYHCDTQGQDRVSSFEEKSTCNYKIVISTPRLCEEMSLSHRYHAEAHKIECRPIVSDKLIEEEKKEYLLLQEQQQQLEQQVEEQGEELERFNEDESNLLTEKEEIQKLLDSVVSKEAKEDDRLIELISDLTEQITQLRAQMNAIPTEPKTKKAEFSLFTLDENGNIIPGIGLNQLIAEQKKIEPKKEQAKDQHNNKQAYQQNYIAAAQ